MNRSNMGSFEPKRDLTRCKLLQSIPDPLYHDMLVDLEDMRKKYPQYRDDELLMALWAGTVLEVQRA
jgi:hypothetical protein